MSVRSARRLYWMLREYLLDLKSIDVQGWLDWFAANKDAFEAIDVILGILGILLIVPIIWVIKRFLKLMRPHASMPNPYSGVHDAPSNNREVRVGGDNPGVINAGAGTIITAGDNATIVVGYTIEKHEAILKSREAHLRVDLTRASTAEKQVIQLELSIVRERLVGLKTSYDEAVQENARLKSELAAFAEYIPDDEIIRAQDALEIGDKSTADAILNAAEERSQNIFRSSARMAYLRGEIAEGEIRWQDALDHYKRAYGQDATLEHQQAYARLSWQMGKWDDAVTLLKDILKKVAAEHGKAGNEYATALNNLAMIYHYTGRYSDAEPLYDQALSITRRVLGADHLDTASSLNNLVGLYYEQGRYAKATPVYMEAVEIMERVVGAEHPNTKMMRENYEVLLVEMKE